jgi:hypothetical protein
MTLQMSESVFISSGDFHFSQSEKPLSLGKTQIKVEECESPTLVPQFLWTHHQVCFISLYSRIANHRGTRYSEFCSLQKQIRDSEPFE